MYIYVLYYASTWSVWSCNNIFTQVYSLELSQLSYEDSDEEELEEEDEVSDIQNA